MNVYEKAAQWIAGADALVITAGAGMGVDSGLPDFRGDSGFGRRIRHCTAPHLSRWPIPVGLTQTRTGHGGFMAIDSTCTAR